MQKIIEKSKTQLVTFGHPQTNGGTVISVLPQGLVLNLFQFRMSIVSRNLEPTLNFRLLRIKSAVAF